MVLRKSYIWLAAEGHTKEEALCTSRWALMVHWADTFLSFIVLCICEQRGSPTLQREQAAFTFPFTPTKSVPPCSPRWKVWEMKHCQKLQLRTLRDKVCPCCSWTVRGEETICQAVTMSCRRLSSFWINIEWHFWDGAHTSNGTLICLSMHVKNRGTWS